MKKRLKKKLLDKPNMAGDHSDPGNIPERVFPDETRSKQGPILQIEIRDMAGLATNIWLAIQRIRGNNPDAEMPSQMRKIHRPLLSAIEHLEHMGVHISDYTGKKFVYGMALNVISSQPNPNLSEDRVCEMLKPSIYFKDHLIQVGDVVIEGPLSVTSTEKEN